MLDIYHDPELYQRFCLSRLATYAYSVHGESATVCFGDELRVCDK
jgi:hypothetical protein